jgi:ankyrin repeat protein
MQHEASFLTFAVISHYWQRPSIQSPLYGLIKRLLNAGAKPISFYSETGDACLHEAVKKNRLDLVMLLLRHGADKQKKNKVNI